MGGQSSTRQRAPGSGQALSRRKIFTSAMRRGGRGGASRADDGHRFSRRPPRRRPRPPSRGRWRPPVVNLTDAATIAVDASLGNDFRVTIAGNRTMGNPANPTNGQQIIFQVTQGSGGSFTLAWGSGYEFSGDLPQPTLSTTAGQTDLLGFIYNATKGTWLFAAFVNGFS